MVTIQNIVDMFEISTMISTVMASIHQRPRSPYWHASYLGPDGRQILRSTKLTDRQAALGMAIELERASKLARRGELVETQARQFYRSFLATPRPHSRYRRERIQRRALPAHCLRQRAFFRRHSRLE